MARSICVVRLVLSLVAMDIFAIPSRGQLSPSQTDALSKLQSSANSAACSATDVSSCAQAAAKLMPVILGDSPMIENLRKLTDEIGGRVSGTPEMAKAVQWGVAGFRAAGVDVHTEKYKLPVMWKEGATRLIITAPASAIAGGATLRVVSEGWAPGTTREGIEANA
ncbi:MAG TPA: hypothetical protein VFR42_05480, partial [Candidatus Acidoferrum sp.]|nr:hypothetical protein [Candidatus Acidoferrum sp.]